MHPYVLCNVCVLGTLLFSNCSVNLILVHIYVHVHMLCDLSWYCTKWPSNAWTSSHSNSVHRPLVMVAAGGVVSVLTRILK